MMIFGVIQKMISTNILIHTGMKVMIDEEQKRLVKRFKTMLNQYGIDRNTELALLAGYGKESCKDMSAYELIELCDNLQKTHDDEYKKLDKLRKRVLAAAIAVNGLRGYPTTVDYAKHFIVHAARDFKSFNSISKERLNSLYAAFKNMQKDLKSVKELTVTGIAETSRLN